MKFVDETKTWLFGIAFQKGVTSVVSVTVAWLLAHGAVAWLAANGAEGMDATTLTNLLTAVMVGSLKIVRNFIKTKYGVAWLAVLIGLGLYAAPVGAVEIPPVSTNTPVAVRALADGLHILDNGSLLYLRDLKNGVDAFSSATALYKKYYVSGDGLLGVLSGNDDAKGFYAVGGRLWAGQFLYDMIPQVKTLADSTGLAAALLQYATVGGWGTRDFQYGVWRYGWSAGFTVNFDALSGTK